MINTDAFKAYDIRGIYPLQIDREFAEGLARAFCMRFRPEKIIIGYDMRLSSPELAAALERTFRRCGVETLNIGLCGTELVYYAVSVCGADGGIMVTASHNPSDYNGFKLVGRGSVPVSGDTGLFDIRDLMEKKPEKGGGAPAAGAERDLSEEYAGFLLSLVDTKPMDGLRITADCGNGCAGPILDVIGKKLPAVTFLRHNETPDGTFPRGVPNPLLPQNRSETSKAVLADGALFGCAWDGDFDRCFFFDEKGRFIEGYYTVALFAERFLEKDPGGKILCEPRNLWNTVERVKQYGGVPVVTKTGHAFMKERMRAEDAVYGGEMSAHHYFRDFFYCDSGMLPMLLMAEILGKTGKTLSELIGPMMDKYPVSGEINFTVSNAAAALKTAERALNKETPLLTDRTDGLSMDFPRWRFNLRASNTEPFLRLNIETRADRNLLEKKIRFFRNLIGSPAGDGNP